MNSLEQIARLSLISIVEDVGDLQELEEVLLKSGKVCEHRIMLKKFPNSITGARIRCVGLIDFKC